jgi:hypothetical protein
MGIVTMALNLLLGAILDLLGITLEVAPAFADVGSEPNLEDAPAILGLFVVISLLTLCAIGIWYLFRDSRRGK